MQQQQEEEEEEESRILGVRMPTHKDIISETILGLRYLLEYIMKIFKYVSKMGSKAVCVFRRRKLGHFADLNEVCENTSTSANVLFSSFIFSDYTLYIIQSQQFWLI